MSKLRAAAFEDTAPSGISVPAKYLTRGTAKAWVNFNGSGTIASRASLNLTSLTDNGAGDYTTTFTSAFASADHAHFASSDDLGASVALTGCAQAAAPTTTTSRFEAASVSKDFDRANIDPTYVYSTNLGVLA